MLLKGHVSRIATPEGVRHRVTAPTTWLATAGSGDALAGILGALVATHSRQIAADTGVLARLTATACVLHGEAGRRASGGGPMTVMQLCAELPVAIADLLGTAG